MVFFSLANQYAFTHFNSQGRAGGRIWHNELCMPDGSDRDASTDVRTQPIPLPHLGFWVISDMIPCVLQENGQIHMSVDNGYTIHVNEQVIGSSEDWTTTDSYTFVAPCETPTV